MASEEEDDDHSIPFWMFDEAQINKSPTIHSTTNYLSYTNETVVRRVYHLARILHTTLTKSGIIYWTSGGTLLGCVRHTGLIPWDDDLDFCIYRKDTDKIDQLKRLLNENDCEIAEAPVFGYRVYHKTESEKLPRQYQKHRYPFCDIFVMKRKHRITLIASGSGRSLWPMEYYNNKDIDNMVCRLFGDVYLNCTANAEEYLERTYGEEWYTHGSTHNYDHLKQEYVNPVMFELKPEHYEPAKPYR